MTFFALCLGVLTGSPAAAEAGVPLPEFRTVETPHFRLNYPVGLEPVAFRAARICEEAHERLVPFLHHRPTERTEVSISDFGDSANGSATALPQNRMTLLAAPPTLDGNLGDYDDWLRLLIYHEYAHILHLDIVHGLPAALNRVFGKKFAPNQNMPSFMLEGTAVYIESLASNRGRIRSAMFRGWLRSAAMDGSLHDVDVVTHAPLRFPSANVWYMYGGHFIAYVARTHGSDILGRMFARYGHDLIPYGLNRAAKEASGLTVTEMFAAWQAELRARSAIEAGLVAAAVTSPHVRATPERLTRSGYRHENPRFLEDGTLLSIDADAQTEADVYAREAGGDGGARVFLKLESTERFDLCPGARRPGTLVFDQVDSHSGAFVYTDLWLWDGRRERRLTRGARIRDPACARGGRWAVGVQIVAGRTRLVRVDLADGSVSTLYDPGGLGQVAHPTISPDGQTIAFVAVTAARRDVALLTVAEGTLPSILTWRTDDTALELRPRFTPDGRELLFASDRSGTFELYRGDVTARDERALTASVGGTIEGELSPDGRTLVTVDLVAGGQDLGRLRPVPHGAPAHSLSALGDPASAPTPREDLGDRPLPTRPYDPTDSIWPTVWAPKFALSTPEDNAEQLGITIDATDALHHHSLLADFATRPDAGGYAVRMAWGYHRRAPSFGLSGSHETRVRDGGQFYGDQRHPLRENVSTLSGSTGLGISRGGHSGSISARLTGAFFEPAENPARTYDPLDQVPAVPEASRTTDLSLSMRYRNQGRLAESISDETGFSVGATLRLRDRLLGSQTETAEAFLDYQHGVGLWWRHALALRLSSAFGAGSRDRPVAYALGPAPDRNVLLDALDQIAFGSTFLRGFPVGTVVGRRYVLGTLEYRLPIFEVYQGFSMVPGFFREVDLSVFTDWGQARDGDLELRPGAFRKSAGVELASHALLGWRLPVDARTGYAYGFGAAGEHQIYVFLGNWF